MLEVVVLFNFGRLAIIFHAFIDLDISGLVGL